MPLLNQSVSKDGFKIFLYDYKVKDGKRRFFLQLQSSEVSENWNIYVADSPNYIKDAEEIVEALKFQGVGSILKTVGEKTSLDSLNINGRQFEAKRASVDFTPK